MKCSFSRQYEQNINTQLVLNRLHTTFFLFYHGATAPQWVKASSLSRIHDLTQTRHSRQDSSGRVISPTQRPLSDNPQHTQEKNFHAPGTIRTHNPSKRAAAGPRLRPQDHRDTHTQIYWWYINISSEIHNMFRQMYCVTIV